MAIFRDRPIPPWHPDQVREALARESGQSVAALRAEIEASARQLAGGGHLQFEALQQGDFSAEDRAHLDACGFCQELHEAMHPSGAVLGELDRLFVEQQDVEASSAKPRHLLPEIAATRKLRFEAVWEWSKAASVVLAIVGVSSIGYTSYVRSTDPLLALSPNDKFIVARALVEDGQYQQGNAVILNALESGGIDKPTLRSVSAVLETKPLADPADRDRVRQAIARLKAEQENKRIPAQNALVLSGLQIEGGQRIDSYQSLATYLETETPSSPATAAFQSKFVAELREASPSAGPQ